jgi:hypothetical protein
VLCHALFSAPGENVVSKDPNGWELGVHPIDLTETFMSNFGRVASNLSNDTQVRLQFVHADHVVIPVLPEGFHSIGRSSNCALQGIWKKGRVLTYQGHAEFDRFVNGETLKVFGKPIWEEDFLAKSLEQVEKDDDAIWAAAVMLKFFLEDAEEKSQSEDIVMVKDRGIERGLLSSQSAKISKVVEYSQEALSRWMSGNGKTEGYTS